MYESTATWITEGYDGPAWTGYGYPTPITVDFEN